MSLKLLFFHPQYPYKPEQTLMGGKMHSWPMENLLLYECKHCICINSSSASLRLLFWWLMSEYERTTTCRRPHVHMQAHTYTTRCRNHYEKPIKGNIKWFYGLENTQWYASFYVFMNEIKHIHTQTHMWGHILNAGATLPYIIYIQNTLLPWCWYSCNYTSHTLSYTH